MEVPNQRIIARYKELLANRSHEVITMNIAIEMLEDEVKRLELEADKIREDHELSKQALGRANQIIKSIQSDADPSPDVIPGEIVE